MYMTNCGEASNIAWASDREDLSNLSTKQILHAFHRLLMKYHVLALEGVTHLEIKLDNLTIIANAKGQEVHVNLIDFGFTQFFAGYTSSTNAVQDVLRFYQQVNYKRKYYQGMKSWTSPEYSMFHLCITILFDTVFYRMIDELERGVLPDFKDILASARDLCGLFCDINVGNTYEPRLEEGSEYSKYYLRMWRYMMKLYTSDVTPNIGNVCYTAAMMQQVMKRVHTIVFTLFFVNVQVVYDCIKTHRLSLGMKQRSEQMDYNIEYDGNEVEVYWLYFNAFRMLYFKQIVDPLPHPSWQQYVEMECDEEPCRQTAKNYEYYTDMNSIAIFMARTLSEWFHRRHAAGKHDTCEAVGIRCRAAPGKRCICVANHADEIMVTIRELVMCHIHATEMESETLPMKQSLHMLYDQLIKTINVYTHNAYCPDYVSLAQPSPGNTDIFSTPYVSKRNDEQANSRNKQSASYEKNTSIRRSNTNPNTTMPGPSPQVPTSPPHSTLPHPSVSSTHSNRTAYNSAVSLASTLRHNSTEYPQDSFAYNKTPVPDSFASPRRMPSSHAFSSHRSGYSANSMPNDSTVFPSSSAPSFTMPSKSSVKYRYCKPSPAPLASIEPMLREMHIMQQTQCNISCKFLLMHSPLDINNQPVLYTPQNDELLSVYQPHSPSWDIGQPDQNVSILQAKGILLNPDRTQDEEESKLMLEFGEQYS